MWNRSTVEREQSSSDTRVVASFPSYDRAQRAVDALADERFPVEHLSIVAHDVRVVEQVTGRRGYVSSLMQGLSSGALVGAAIGFLLGFFSLVDPLASAIVVAIWGAVFGAISGAVVGLFTYALSGGHRDFSSTSSVKAARFDVVAEERVADEAQRRLERAHLIQLPAR
ncbi:MAG: glycine zipper family protein [Actinomycetota bacterium]|nr:glycine zipper family protein [Actinomycetota bacterium]